ncbi:MAG: TRAP transporter substrate-binding protein [Flavobacteriaceae bacterium]
MKHLRTLILSAATAMVVATGFATSASAQDVTLRYSKWLPDGYFLQRDLIFPWFKDVERVTEGRVKIEPTPKAVGTVPGQYDVVADGLADMTFIVAGYTPGRFPLTEGVELPFLGDDPLQRSPAVWQAYEEYLKPAGTFSEVHMLSVFATNAAHFAMTKKIIEKIEDLDGMKIRTPSPSITRAIELVGATPVSKPSSELYELASSGIIDGAVFPLDPIPGFKLEGVLRKITYIPGGFGSTVVGIPINKAAWEKISEKDRKAIEEISGAAFAVRAAKVIAAELEKARKVIEDAGAEIVVANDQLVSDLKARIEPMRGDWIAAAREKGMKDPEGMLAVLQEN